MPTSEQTQRSGAAEPKDSSALAHAPILTAEQLAAILPTAGKALIALYHAPLIAAMEAANINTPIRIAHFLTQVVHESGDFRFTHELASGQAYEGRADLGNTQPGDGRRFKGRGLIQLTGRANYAAYGASIGQDLTSAGAWERVATDPDLAIGVATWFWTRRHLNAFADKDDLEAITQRVNGGLNGLEDRRRHLERAKSCLQCVA